jgi:hypothetical protein
MLDEKEFLSPYGIRSLSRYHLDHPYVFNTNGQAYTVQTGWTGLVATLILELGRKALVPQQKGHASV